MRPKSTQPKVSAPSHRTPVEQQSHGTHCIFSWRAQGQPSAGCQASAMTPLYPVSHWDCFLCTPVPGHQQLQGRLLILQDLCTHSDSAHRVLEAATTMGMVTLSLPRSQGTCDHEAHTNQRMKKTKCDLWAGFCVLISQKYDLGHKSFWIKVRPFPPGFRTWLLKGK